MNTSSDSAHAKVSEQHEGASALECVAHVITRPDNIKVFGRALDKYGDCFATFLLGTGAYLLPPNELIQTFEKSYVLCASSEDMAYEGLAHLSGIVDGFELSRSHKKRKGSFEYIPPCSSDVLRERLSEEYLLISLLSVCYVFDASVIRDSLNR